MQLRQAIVLFLSLALAFPIGEAHAGFKGGGGVRIGGGFKGGGGSGFKPKGFSAPKSSPKSLFTSPKTQQQKPSGFSGGGGGSSKPPKAKGFNSVVRDRTTSSGPKNTYTTFQDRKSAAKAFNARKAEVAKSREAPEVKRYTSGRSYDRKTVYVQRDVYINTHPAFGGYYRHYGGWWGGCYNCYYGGYQPGFLMAMAMSDNPGQAALWYAWSGNPWFAVWMSQAREKAKAQSDPAVLARLDKIEQDVRARKEQGAVAEPVDQTLKQMGVPAEVALSAETLTGEVDEPEVEKSGGWFWPLFFGLMIGGCIIYFFMRSTPILRRRNPMA